MDNYLFKKKGFIYELDSNEFYNPIDYIPLHTLLPYAKVKLEYKEMADVSGLNVRFTATLFQIGTKLLNFLDLVSGFKKLVNRNCQCFSNSKHNVKRSTDICSFYSSIWVRSLSGFFESCYCVKPRSLR